MESDRKKSIIFGWITFVGWASTYLFYLPGLEKFVQNSYVNIFYLGAICGSFLCALLFRIRYQRATRKDSEKPLLERILEFLFLCAIGGMIAIFWSLAENIFHL